MFSMERRAHDLVEQRRGWEEYGQEGNQQGLAGEIERLYSLHMHLHSLHMLVVATL